MAPGSTGKISSATTMLLLKSSSTEREVRRDFLLSCYYLFATYCVCPLLVSLCLSPSQAHVTNLVEIIAGGQTRTSVRSVSVQLLQLHSVSLILCVLTLFSPTPPSHSTMTSLVDRSKRRQRQRQRHTCVCW